TVSRGPGVTDTPLPAGRESLPDDEVGETLRVGVGYFLSSFRHGSQRVFTEEARLVRRCLKGDAEAIQALVDQYQAVVYGLCVRLLTHRHDAEDVTQEVFLRIFRSLRRWDPSRPLKPWIMGITVNRCRTWLVQRARRPELADYLQ